MIHAQQRLTSVWPAFLLVVAIAAAWFAPAGTAATCSVPSFQMTNIALNSPRALVVDDFNKDGNQDVAVAEQTSVDRIAILLGNGSGGFSAPTRFDMGRDPVFIAAGDLNGDTNPDLVTANESNVSGEISIALGNGSGGFGSPTNIRLINGTSNVTSAVAIGDVNGDTKPDLVLSSYTFSSVMVLLGNGTGGFTFFKTIGAGGFGPFYLVMRDFNGDTKLDLVTANNGAGTVGVLLGDGTGNFGPATTFGVGTSPHWITVEDFNSDSKLDLAVANGGSENFSILLGNGTGGFGAATNQAAKGGPWSIAPADFNGDGKIDLAVSIAQPGTLAIFTGDGAGGFSPVANFRNGGPSSAVSDFNEDGQLDIAVVKNFGPHTLSVFLNTCGASTLPELQLSLGAWSGSELDAEARRPIEATVIRTGDITGAASVDYATSNGSATAPQDYISVSGTLNFQPGEISKIIQIPLVDDTITEPLESFSLTLSNVTGMATLGSPSVATIFIAASDPLPTVQFSSSGFSAGEGVQSFQITVTRAGNTQSSSSVAYATSDGAGSDNCSATNGNASSRCDYLTTIGTLHFAASETSKIISIPVVDDVYVEPNESFIVTLSNPVGATLGSPSTTTLTINANDTAGASNPIDQASFFVRQHYLDFLNREPDASGLAFWSNQITECQQPGATCSAEVRRINVSAAFFVSIEFQETGYLVYRFYRAAYGNSVGGQVPLRLNEFLPDTQQIGLGLVVGAPGWQEKLESNKVAYAQDFVSRSRLISAYPTTSTPAEFVDALFTSAGVTPSTADRDAAINEFAGAANSSNTAARGRALRRVAENPAFSQQETNRAFVLMQYFGYLRRNPNDAPEPGLNFAGYNFWLGKLNEFNGNYIAAEMVKAFIDSAEYRQRFGP